MEYINYIHTSTAFIAQRAQLSYLWGDVPFKVIVLLFLRLSRGGDMHYLSQKVMIALIVGIPYPKPTARQRGLQRYYDLKFRKGWEYTVEAPTARKILQSIGRLIRDEKDRGVAVILDRRATRFKRYIRDLQESKSLMDDMKSFIEKN